MLLCLWLLLCYQMSSRDKMALKAIIVYYLSFTQRVGWPLLQNLEMMVESAAIEMGSHFFFFNLFLAVLNLCCCAQGSSSCSKRGLLPFVVVYRLPFAVASHCRAGALGHMDFSSCDYRALEHGLGSCGMALVASWHVGSCRIRDWTWVPCIGMQILNLWTAREDLGSQF